MDDQLFEATMAAVKRHFDAEEFERALPLVTKAYEARPDNSVVCRSRIYALLNCSQWENALKVCDKHSDEDLAFERAYILYRLNRFQEALKALSGQRSEDESGRCARLEAQVRYRMADYEVCAGMYEKLYDNDAEDVGLLVNAVASCVSGDRASQALSLLSKNEESLESSYELCFNMSCALIDEGRLKDAEARLRAAEELCIQDLLQAEDLTEEDRGQLEDHEELAAIKVQRACVLQRSGDEEEAKQLYDRVLKQGPGASEIDVTVLATACNNVVALRSEGKSLFDSLKRINVASKESLEHKLTQRQTVEIAGNKVLLLLQAHRNDEARRELEKLRQSCPNHPRVAVVQAAIAHKDKKGKACEELLQAYIAEHQAHEEVVLPLAQLYAQQQLPEKAVEVLAKLPPSSQAQPKTLEAIVALHHRQKSPEKALACLRAAMKFWSEQSDEESEQRLGQVLRIAANAALQAKDRAFAAEVFQLYLEKIDGSDNEALCGLVEALASTDAERAAEYARRLQVPSFDHLDPEELEAVPIPKVGAVLSQRKKDEAPAEGEDDAKKHKTKRRRKIRYPKNFDPENPGPPPDPERWLPKRERAEFKKKMRKRDKHLLRGPQGAMVTSDDFRKQGPSTAQVEVSKDDKTGAGRRKKKGK
eukprot:TRINITY_DN105548_c0_g1_i1.p1 TRINITY_DN105548_c0_g1~~TRINITY_DN105548_c0_g1_i1.p1  ORF type:complete len:648 (+),score=179.33 TRINITY_DN105548_c0_g1_i1:90-2033(+)